MTRDPNHGANAVALLAPHDESFATEDRNRSAFVRASALALMAVPAIVAIGFAAIGQGFRVAIVAPIAVVGYLGWRLVGVSNVQAGFRVWIYGTWFCVLICAILVNGVASPVIAGLAVVLIFAGWLTGKRSVIVLTAATPPALFVLAYAHAASWPLPLPGRGDALLSRFDTVGRHGGSRDARLLCGRNLASAG